MKLDPLARAVLKHRLAELRGQTVAAPRIRPQRVTHNPLAIARRILARGGSLNDAARTVRMSADKLDRALWRSIGGAMDADNKPAAREPADRKTPAGAA